MSLKQEELRASLRAEKRAQLLEANLEKASIKKQINLLRKKQDKVDILKRHQDKVKAVESKKEVEKIEALKYEERHSQATRNLKRNIHKAKLIKDQKVKEALIKSRINSIKINDSHKRKEQVKEDEKILAKRQVERAIRLSNIADKIKDKEDDKSK